jgi:3-oxoadipate enol-lactonase
MTLILGSSLGTPRALWEHNALGADVLRYDHRGHGTAPAPPGPWELGDFGRDVLALMDREGIERASVGGISLGGMVAMWLGIHAPERVESLVLCCTTAYFPDKGPWRDRIAAVREAGTTEAVADAVVERWLTPPYAAAHPETVDALRAMLVSTPAEGYALACEALADMDLRADLGRIRAPTLVISAAEDPSTPPPMQQEIAAAIGGARLEVVEGAAHLANVERAEAVDRLILEFLDES